MDSQAIVGASTVPSCAIDNIQDAFTDGLFTLLDDGFDGPLGDDGETPCFCRGTRIRTAAGDVPVEDLKIGDLIVSSGGQLLPLKWIVRRSYRDWAAVGNSNLQPVCFKAGSIDDHVPAHDLLVSPEHAMFLEGVLIPARLLVNGISVLQMEGLEQIDYFHLELDRHAVILAEGAEAESFASDENAVAFHNSEYRRLYPDAPPAGHGEYCAPFVEDGQELDAARRRLISRADTLLPDAAIGSEAALSGWLDTASRQTIEGWAFSEDSRHPVALAILANGAIIGRTVADRYRADLRAAGVGDGHHCFRFSLPETLPPELSHSIEVRRESDWSILPGAPRILSRNSKVTNAGAPPWLRGQAEHGALQTVSH